MLVADIKLRGGAILCVVPKGASAKSASNASPFVANLPSIDDSKVSAGASLTPRKSIKSTYKHSTPSSQSSCSEPLAEPSQLETSWLRSGAANGSPLPELKQKWDPKPLVSLVLMHYGNQFEHELRGVIDLSLPCTSPVRLQQREAVNRMLQHQASVGPVRFSAFTTGAELLNYAAAISREIIALRGHDQEALFMQFRSQILSGRRRLSELGVNGNQLKKPNMWLMLRPSKSAVKAGEVTRLCSDEELLIEHLPLKL